MTDVGRLLASRVIRGVVDGMVSVTLGVALAHRGLQLDQVGWIVTLTLVGSAVTTIVAGLSVERFGRRTVLNFAALLMGLTGVGFGLGTSFSLLLIVAFAGTLNPSGGDVSLFLPTELAVLAQVVSPAERTSVFARYNVLGAVAISCGALMSAMALRAGASRGFDAQSVETGIFIAYAAAAPLVLLLYSGLSARIEVAAPTGPTPPLSRSRRVVYRLAALFSLDSLGGGFVVQSLLVVWLKRRFDMPLESAGVVFFAAGLLSAGGQLLSGPLARCIGLIPTMVFTHLPANMFLALAGTVSDVRLAVALLLARSALSSMDVPARQAYVMALVPPQERAAAASITNVPRSLAAALPPLAVGWMLEHSTFGWPLICAGTLKSIYDLLLLREFAHVELPEEQPRSDP